MKNMKKIVIALDGHSACGKSTLAKFLAKELSYVYIDSGAMYRAVTLYCLNNGLINNNEDINDENVINALSRINISFNYNRTSGKSDTFLNGLRVEDEIREMRVSNFVSAVSKIKQVREKLVEFQQNLGKNKGVVMDGRDIGTVVFPGAELKLWITANLDIRAARRYKEYLEGGHEVSLEDVIQNVKSRDFADSNRLESPLVKAEDAVEIDNSFLSKQETFQKAIRLVNEKLIS